MDILFSVHFLIIYSMSLPFPPLSCTQKWHMDPLNHKDFFSFQAWLVLAFQQFPPTLTRSIQMAISAQLCWDTPEAGFPRLVHAKKTSRKAWTYRKKCSSVAIPVWAEKGYAASKQPYAIGRAASEFSLCWLSGHSPPPFSTWTSFCHHQSTLEMAHLITAHRGGGRDCSNVH